VVYTGFCRESERKNHLEDPGVDGSIILIWTFRKLDVETWTGWSWFRIGTGGGFLRMR
jgi:hypothetical protein